MNLTDLIFEFGGKEEGTVLCPLFGVKKGAVAWLNFSAMHSSLSLVCRLGDWVYAIIQTSQKRIRAEYRKGTVNMARAKWYELDNNAKIVPSTTKGSDTRVFRITCELKEEVNGALLQHALDRTVPDFPHFASVLRKGLFWYYLDSSNIHAVVQQENKPACAPIYWDGRRRLLYRVNYYRRRINLEMFHVLTDGTGAFDFLRAIVCNYALMRRSHRISPV